MKKEDIKKVVLAYSGGLDTSIIIPWLKENYNNCEVIAVSGDVGQGTELDGLEEKAKATGASKLYVLDLKKDFVENYIFPTLKFGAKYEDYLLGTSFARPCIAKALADIAIKEGADAICHGCTGKGNDQVRFELTLKALCPDMAIIAPWREWDIKSRDEEIDYAEAHHIPLKINRETNYSKDKNLWHLSHEGLDLESPANEPQYNHPGFLELGVSPEQAPDTPTYITPVSYTHLDVYKRQSIRLSTHLLWFPASSAMAPRPPAQQRSCLLYTSGEVLVDIPVHGDNEETLTDRSLLDMEHIWDFANTVDVEDVRSILEPQILSLIHI